jgi:uncharacterized protein
MIKMKREIRIMGIDDSPFDKFKDKKVLVVASLYRGGNYIDGLLSDYVSVDGSDSTKKMILMINKSKFKPQIQCIMLKGIAVAGFNVIDINELQKKTKIPVIVVMRIYPNLQIINDAIKNVMNWKKKWNLIVKAGKINEIKIKKGKLFCQLSGINENKAKEFLSISCTNSNIPEPLRVSHIIASGIVKGESGGDA